MTIARHVSGALLALAALAIVSGLVLLVLAVRVAAWPYRRVTEASRRRVMLEQAVVAVQAIAALAAAAGWAGASRPGQPERDS